jgi:transposase
MDNATFHKGGRISQLIEGTGCQLLYLPPYSPDLNKIEQCWSWLKSRIRKQLHRFNCLPDATLGCLASCVRRRRARLL